MHNRIVAIAILFFSFTLQTQAEVYRWTDENGKVHFSDKPVSSNAKKIEIKVKPSAPVDPQTREDRKERAEQYLRARQQERKEKQQQREKQKQQAAELKKKCQSAREKYQETIEAGSVYYKNKDGSRDYLDDTRRKKAEADLKSLIKKFCK